MEYETTKSNIYTTSDLGVASALVSKNFRVIQIERSNPRRAIFCFEKSEKLEDAVKQYWSGDLFVSAKDLQDSIKSLKARLYGES